MKGKNSFIIIITVLILSVLCITSCGTNSTGQPDKNNATEKATETTSTALPSGGVIYLKAIPEIHIHYDENGLVTDVISINEAAAGILENYKNYKGKDCLTVINELVSLIGEAGHFVDETEGNDRQITLEIEKGSKLPTETFVDDIISEVKSSIRSHNWNIPMDVYNDSEHYYDDDIYDDDDFDDNDDNDDEQDDDEQGDDD